MLCVYDTFSHHFVNFSKKSAQTFLKIIEEFGNYTKVIHSCGEGTFFQVFFSDKSVIFDASTHPQIIFIAFPIALLG